MSTVSDPEDISISPSIFDDEDLRDIYSIYSQEDNHSKDSIALSGSYTSREEDDLSSYGPLNYETEIELLRSKPSSIAKQEKEERKYEETIDYAFEKKLRDLSNDLLAANRHREWVRSELAEAIASKQFNERERKILEDNDSDFKRKRSERDYEEALKCKGTNTLAEGDNFNFVFTGQYGTKHVIAGKVRSFIDQKGSSRKKQKILCSPSYPAIIDIVFQQDESKLDPVFGKKGQRHLLKEGLEKRVNFH